MKSHHSSKGFFGIFGGRYIPEMLFPTVARIEKEFERAKRGTKFNKEFRSLLKEFSGRPTPLIFARNLTQKLGGAKLYFKNEGMNHTGAHKITHCIGQALMARRLGMKTLIAETGAGQHGLATATVAAKLGMKCKVFMGSVDMDRQRQNVFLMEQLGAEVIPVTYGSKTLKDAVNEAIKYWMNNSDDCYYVLGSALGPHPYPTMNHYFQSVVSEEMKQQLRQKEKRLPTIVIACVGGGSNAIGAFSHFISKKKVKLVAVEAGGRGKKIGQHASKTLGGKLGILQGYKSLFLQDDSGQILPTHSIAAGLDYPGVGPELAHLHSTRRIRFEHATDAEAMAAFQTTARHEGIIPALESSHALAYAFKCVPKMKKSDVVVVNISGRGDKDIFNVARYLNDQKLKNFLLDEYNRYEK